MTELRVGKKTTWGEVEIGEVFALNACWIILYKISHRDAIILAHDYVCDMGKYEYGSCVWGSDSPFGFSSVQYLRYLKRIQPHSCLYKLPKSVQALWKQGE